MENSKALKQILDDHERRLSNLEARLSKSKQTVTTKGKTKLSDHIIDLRDKAFFAQPKTAEETHSKLQSTYHCDLNRVAVALLRLSNRKQLRRASKSVNKKTYQAYVW